MFWYLQSSKTVSRQRRRLRTRTVLFGYQAALCLAAWSESSWDLHGLFLSFRVHMAVAQNQWYHFGVGEFTPDFRTYFNGDWDVRWGYDLDFYPWLFSFLGLGGSKGIHAEARRCKVFVSSPRSWTYRPPGNARNRPPEIHRPTETARNAAPAAPPRCTAAAC